MGANCGCPGTAAAVSFHQTTNLCLKNLEHSPSNAVLALLDKLEHVTWTVHIRTSARSGSPTHSRTHALSLFSPATDKSDMVGLLLHLSGCAIIDHFVSSRNCAAGHHTGPSPVLKGSLCSVTPSRCCRPCFSLNFITSAPRLS